LFPEYTVKNILPQTSTAMQSKKNKQILIIDDVPAIRDLFKRYLNVDNYEVYGAESGEQGLQLAKESEFDGILLDLNMQGIDGIETCRQLRTLEKYKFTPILIITAADNNTTLSSAFEAGCDDFIAKPINQIILRARLKAHIQRSELYKQQAGMRELVSHYVSPRIQEIIGQYVGTDEFPPPERREVCVLFTDIRGFTELAQKLDPEELFKLLSEHLTRQAELVYEFGGYVDNYAGDGITAIFEGPEMEQKSCLCAQNIIAHAQDLIVQRQSHLFAVSCGISKGMVVFGDIGSAAHRKYTVVGGTVNLAARLCGCAGPITIIVTGNIYEIARQDQRLLFLPREDIKVNGVENNSTMYELTPHLSTDTKK